MKKINFKLAAGTAIVGAMFAYNASAVPVTNDAAVTIVQALVVTANDDMNFGKVQKPASGTVDVVVDDAGSLSGAAVVDATGASQGTVDISGGGSTVQIVLTDSANETGLNLKDFTGTFGGQSLTGTGGSTETLTGVTLTGGTDVFDLGATLVVASSAGTGLQNPSYTIDVTYE